MCFCQLYTAFKPSILTSIQPQNRRLTATVQIYIYCLRLCVIIQYPLNYQ